MRTRLLHWLNAASCLLAVSFTALWVRSYSVNDRLSKSTYAPLPVGDGLIHVMHPRGFIALRSVDGRIGFTSGTDGPFPADPEGLSSYLLPGDDEVPPKPRQEAERLLYSRSAAPAGYWRSHHRAARSSHRLGFSWRGQWEHVPLRWYAADGSIPYWALVSPTALPTLVSLMTAAQKRARIRNGLCLQCAYDLRGNPAPARCPECGTPAPAPPAGSAARAAA